MIVHRHRDIERAEPGSDVRISLPHARITNVGTKKDASNYMIRLRLSGLTLLFKIGRDADANVKPTALASTGGTMNGRMAIIPALLLSAVGGALAQSQDEQQACTNDAFQFCQNAIPDRDRVFNCLVENRSFLSVACHTVMGPYLPADPPPAKRKAASTAKATKITKPKGPLSLSPQ
jgi:hypothetical protein